MVCLGEWYGVVWRPLEYRSSVKQLQCVWLVADTYTDADAGAHTDTDTDAQCTDLDTATHIDTNM